MCIGQEHIGLEFLSFKSSVKHRQSSKAQDGLALKYALIMGSSQFREFVSSLCLRGFNPVYKWQELCNARHRTAMMSENY